MRDSIGIVPRPGHLLHICIGIVLALIHHHGKHEIGFILAIKVSILHGHRCWASTGVEIGQGGQGALELSMKMGRKPRSRVKLRENSSLFLTAADDPTRQGQENK